MDDNFYMDDFEDDYSKKTVLLVKQLTLQCPKSDPLDSCALSKFRKLPLKEKLEMVDTMSSEELDEIVQQHYDCFHERE